MDNNNKKQQQQQRTNKSSAEAQRKSSDLHVNKTRNSRRREQLATPRNEQQQRNVKQPQQQQQQQQQQQPAKLRANVDKRPRARGGNGNGSGYGQGSSYGDGDGDGSAGTDADYFNGSTGLAAMGAGYKRSGDLDYELNSVYVHGSKKQNLNHLLNFHCVPRHELSSDWHATGHGHGGHGVVSRRQPRYNKEQFLQANFQFVIRSSAKAQVNGSPDTLIDWNLIEQINIHTTEEPQCPICLYPPVAAKLTRCGHAYCWPCLLHYLSLSDKTWRKCPICYDAIHAADLKSCTIEQQQSMNMGDSISFQLMRRRKGSMYIERYAEAELGGAALEHERFPLLSALDDAKRFSKFLVARRVDVAAIIDRERRELLAESDISCPEDIFIQQALLTLNERCDKLGLEPEEQPQQQQQLPLQLVEEEQQVKILDIDEKPDDASVSSLGEASSCSSSYNNNQNNNIHNTNKYYYFYQSNDGQNIYLHPLNVKMLQACYGTLDLAPVLIKAPIIQKDHHSMDEEHRRKFTCLGHLPLTCQFAVVEVELQPPIIAGSILKLFKDDLLHRKKERQRREREERKREKHINEINDRQMGKLIASAANLNLSSTHEFPTCGFEEELPAPRGSMPISIGEASSVCYSRVAASPKQELWPSIGSVASPGNSSGPEFQMGAWGRAAPPTPKAAPVANRPTLDEENELRAVGPWALGELFVGALGQQKQQRGGGKANTSAVDASASKKQKKAKGKKMVPLFAVGMNRAP
ncbi:RING finger protein 10 [Drosophila innubila]|uniref:RING finger protein 10 n=1 Tax=Drosophila innubila TaxID=198719 RepID=UPI00148C8974|nr:RING finger protein 10 [Drosophila innubila]